MKNDLDSGRVLPIMEHFYTLQGEGFHTGKASYFIRIGGCDVGCHWCDVKESWDAKKHPLIPIDAVVKQAIKHSKTIVLTGGEPLMYNLEPLTSALKKEGCTIHIETSGAYVNKGIFDWYTISPKKNKLPQKENYEIADELKLIVYNQHDFIFAEELAKKVKPECKLFLQPEWSKREKIMPMVIDFILKNPKWQISIQTHKYMNIP